MSSWAETAVGNLISSWVRFILHPNLNLRRITDKGHAAIRFVLSDAHASLTREERQRLLHEGTSTQTTLSAFVEIVFDSESGRM